MPRKEGYEDVTKFNVTIRKPICQAVAKVEGCQEGTYQQVNIPQKSMTVSDFRDLANSKTYATPEHKSFDDLEKIYWDKITDHAGIYGADVIGSISDPDLTVWNINSLNTILDVVGKDYNMSIDGVNTAYLYFGMWKTTFAWHTEDMDLYSINLLHFGAGKTWYVIPPSYGRKFEKLCAVVLPKSSNVCRAFLRHKMTILHTRWLKDYKIPYDKITQEAGEIMITFPYGYHSGFNHGFNCAESTNFAIERWVEYGKHASICYCCPDAVKINMEAFVRRFQPSIFEAWMNGKDTSPHPEYHLNPLERQPPTVYKKLSFKERNPDLNIQEIMDNPQIAFHVKVELNGSFLVSADDEVAGLMADIDEPERKTMFQNFYDDSSDDDVPKKKRRKKHDSDYDDDWFETKGHQFISEDGKTVKKQVRPRRSVGRKTASPKAVDPFATAVKIPKKRQSAPAGFVAKQMPKEVVLPESTDSTKCKQFKFLLL